MTESFPPIPAPISPAIFDGHNDILSVLHKAGMTADAPADIAQFSRGMAGHLDLDKMRNGGFAGGFFAIWVPSPIDLDAKTTQMNLPVYDLPLPPEITVDEALPVAVAQAAILHRMEQAGYLKICTSTAMLEASIANGEIAAIMHIEGAEPIDRDFYNLDMFRRAGLRSIGPVWSRPNRFGHGVPFRYPSTGDIGAGLTEDGKRLVTYCDENGILIDLSHLNEAGFWDVAKISGKPLVATHSNAYAISPHARNLTDRQLAAIAESDGMVGLNFAVAFLRPDGRMQANTGFDIMLRHLDHLIEHLGEDRVGLGSDFDGTTVPQVIGDAAGLPALRRAMIAHGYDAKLMTKLCHANWVNVLGRIWHD
ncbi:MAG: dipeptidase [Candidatus Puniceispirillaceae bacterium]|jgi:membrane dipeptidase